MQIAFKVPIPRLARTNSLCNSSCRNAVQGIVTVARPKLLFRLICCQQICASPVYCRACPICYIVEMERYSLRATQLIVVFCTIVAHGAFCDAMRSLRFSPNSLGFAMSNPPLSTPLKIQLWTFTPEYY